MRQGPRGDVPTGLQRLRHLILCDGLEADNDGMVRLFPLVSSVAPDKGKVSIADIYLAHPPQRSPALDRHLPGFDTARPFTCLLQNSQ